MTRSPRRFLNSCLVVRSFRRSLCLWTHLAPGVRLTDTSAIDLLLVRNLRWCNMPRYSYTVAYLPTCKGLASDSQTLTEGCQGPRGTSANPIGRMHCVIETSVAHTTVLSRHKTCAVPCASRFKLQPYQAVHRKTQKSQEHGRSEILTTGARTALAGPSATCHHPQASNAPIRAASEPLSRPNVSQSSRPMTPATGTPKCAPTAPAS